MVSWPIGNVTQLGLHEASNNVESGGKVSDIIIRFAMEFFKWFLRNCCNYIDPRDF